jgi:hypothetical protein
MIVQITGIRLLKGWCTLFKMSFAELTVTSLNHNRRYDQSKQSKRVSGNKSQEY